MDRILRSLIAFERMTQTIAVIGFVVFLGYLGLSSYQADLHPALPGYSPTMQK
jgi:hypothetical protein